MAECIRQEEPESEDTCSKVYNDIKDSGDESIIVATLVVQSNLHQFEKNNIHHQIGLNM